MKVTNKKLTVFVCIVLIAVIMVFCGYNVGCFDEFNFVYLGDVQNSPEGCIDYANLKKIFRCMYSSMQNSPHFVVLSGDIVNEGDSEEEWEKFIKVIKNEGKNIEWYTAVGNHDNTLLQQKYFNLKDKKGISGDNSFYTFSFKNTQFVFMDSNKMGKPTKQSKSFLENTLKDSKCKYKIVIFHHPVYVSNNNPKDLHRAQTIKSNYINIMEKYNVDIVLNGHQHVYMRTYPLRKNIIDNNGIIYLTSVSSPKTYHGKKFDYVEKLVDNKCVYTIFEIKNDKINVITKDVNNKVIDSFYIKEKCYR